MSASVRMATGTGWEAARARRASSHQWDVRGSARHSSMARAVSAPKAACKRGMYSHELVGEATAPIGGAQSSHVAGGAPPASVGVGA